MDDKERRKFMKEVIQKDIKALEEELNEFDKKVKKIEENFKHLNTDDLFAITKVHNTLKEVKKKKKTLQEAIENAKTELKNIE